MFLVYIQLYCSLIIGINTGTSFIRLLEKCTFESLYEAGCYEQYYIPLIMFIS